MTDWLNVEEVKEKRGYHTPEMALALIVAIGELPNPDARRCRCGDLVCSECRNKWDELQAIWQVARWICEKDAMSAQEPKEGE